MSMFARRMALGLLLSGGFGVAHANGVGQLLPFDQDWSTTTRVTANDDWTGVFGIEGFLGQDLSTATGTDPQTLTGTSAVANDLDVIANQSDTSISNGGVAEFDGISNPTIALQASGTADAPNIVISLNTVGQGGIHVAYTLRDLDDSTDDAVQAVALQYRVGNTGAFINVPAGFVADATTGPGLATLVTPVAATLPAAANNQSMVQVRIITSNAAGNDEWVGIDDISVAGDGSGGPFARISDTTAFEGDAGTTPFLFTISLSEPAGPGGVTIDYATSCCGWASPGSDFVIKSGVASIAEGVTSVTISIDVIADTVAEPDESFFVAITNATGAAIADGHGVGWIRNDDISHQIHEIQGSGASSPLLGSVVTTRGIVTARKSNGYFIQSADADSDSNPATSQGLFVFTGGQPFPGIADVGNLVRMTATVMEFVPTQDPQQPPLTQLGGSSFTMVLSTGNPLPAPVTLTADFPSANGAYDQLESLEGMRVSVPSLTVTAPTGGSTNEPNATGTSNGIYYGVVTGNARPFREAGIEAPDTAPAGSSLPPIPRWDSNPELIAINSRGQLRGELQWLDVATGAVVTGLVGPLDYGSRRYTVLPDAAPVVTAGPAPSAARLPTADEFTVASYNVQRFFDTVDDPMIPNGSGGEPVLSVAAFANRLNKASLAIRNFLNTPDILGVVEMENLSTLQALASRINDDAVAASQPNPEYVAFLQEGNDIGGIDVGFLVKSGEVALGIDRIEVNGITQLGKDEMWTEPAGGSSLLNDRPPLQLDAVVNYADSRRFPITVIVVHQRSLNGAEDDTAGGVRVRAKRQRQAEYLANRIQALQTADPDRHITVLGDFNAFEFNDGYVDAMNVVTGTPTPDNQTAVAGDGVDLVDPDLMNLFVEEPADQRYSFVFDGNAQSLDHVLINQALGAHVADFSLDHARINADFPEVNRNDANSPSRLSDHDPAVAYYAVLAPSIADLSVFARPSPIDRVEPGSPIGFHANIENRGPESASFPAVGFAFDAALPDLIVTPRRPEWTCDAPQVTGNATTVACHTAELASDRSASFDFTATAPAGLTEGFVTMVMVATSQSEDPDETNNSATAQVGVWFEADLGLTISGPAHLTRLSGFAPYWLDVRSWYGDVLPAGIRVRVQASAPRDAVAFGPSHNEWNCVPQGDPQSFDAVCTSLESHGPGVLDIFELRVQGIGTIVRGNLAITATIEADAVDPDPGNNQVTRKVRIIGSF